MSDVRETPTTALEQMKRDQERRVEANAFTAIVMNTLRDFLPYRCHREAYDELHAAFLRSDSVLVHRAELQELRMMRERLLFNGSSFSLSTLDVGRAQKQRKDA